MIKGCYVCKRGSTRLEYVYGGGRMEMFSQRLDICPQVIHEDNLDENRVFLRETEVLLATWDMVSFTEEQLAEYFPNLKILLYAAGSVQYFARPFLNRGVKVLSAWGAMCYPVAEFTVSCIVLANKGSFLASRLDHQGDFKAGKELATARFPGTYGTKVGILGAGKIGSLVIEMLRGYKVDVMVYDPFLSDERAAQLGVKCYELEEIFSQCQTISNHIANNDRTVGMLNYTLFSRMKPNAAFINTGRGAQVVEEDLVRALKEEPERCAILDVTWPEPIEKGHPFLSMQNVVLFPHIAGYAAAEVYGMSDCMLGELDRFLQGEPFEFEVTLPMLETMA